MDLSAALFLAFGTLGGFVSSSPLGPINLVIVNNVVSKPKKRLSFLIGGVIIADIAYGMMAAFGFQAIPLTPNQAEYLQFAGACLLVVMGLSGLWSSYGEFCSAKQTTQTDELPTKGWLNKLAGRFGKRSESVKDFLLGAVLCGSNPGFLLWWVYLVQQVQRNFDVSVSPFSAVLFGLGICLGDLIWFGFIIKISKTAKKKMGRSWTRWLRLVVGGCFLAAGLATLIL